MMNVEPLSESLQVTASSVLESAAFAFIEPPGEAENTCGSGRYETGALLRFTGPFPGALIAMTSEKLADILASDMVGLDEIFSGLVDRDDAMKEILNIICGEFLPAIFDSEEDYSIESPINIVKSDLMAFIASGHVEVIAKTKLIIEGEALALLLLRES